MPPPSHAPAAPAPAVQPIPVPHEHDDPFADDKAAPAPAPARPAVQPSSTQSYVRRQDEALQTGTMRGGRLSDELERPPVSPERTAPRGAAAGAGEISPVYPTEGKQVRF